MKFKQALRIFLKNAMAKNFKIPGVCAEEISQFPPSVAGVATAIPAFIGYTERASDKNIPCRITSLQEYEALFGQGPKLFAAEKKSRTTSSVVQNKSITNIEYILYDSIRLFYDNGGGICYIVPVGNYSEPLDDEKFKKGIAVLEDVDEVTLVLFPDAVGLDVEKLAGVQNAALKHCHKMGDRFAILDVKKTKDMKGGYHSPKEDIENFRSKISNNNFELHYGAAYYPYLSTVYTKASLIPPSGAIAGIYSATDTYQGVWKAPANISIASLSGVSDFITNQDQEDMNVDANAGKSINAIRSFTGKGILVWGARTLDGNSNKWRYIAVRRLINYIEKSVQKSTLWAVFSPNDGNTWIKIRSQIENFLNNLWRAGALAGSTPESSYYVKVGLNVTMTAEDIMNGLLIVEVGVAAIRPAEFIILRFAHKVQE